MADNIQTDMSRFLALYKSFGITLNPIKNEEGSGEENPGGYTIILDVTVHEKFTGVSYTTSEVYFSKSEKFIRQSFS